MANEREIDEENDGEETDDVANDTHEEPEEAPPKRPRARAKPTEHRAFGEFGAVPQRATSFGVRKRMASGAFEAVGHREDGRNMETRVWPIALLSEEFILGRWGGGTYRVQWLEANGRP